MTVTQWRAQVRALDIGLAIARRSHGEFLIGLASAPDLDRDALRAMGRQWVAEAKAELVRLDTTTPDPEGDR